MIQSIMGCAASGSPGLGPNTEWEPTREPSGRPIGPARSRIIAIVVVVGLDLARDLARAMIWGILFRLPCARFTPGRAYDQRPQGRVRSPPWSDYFGRL
jgi:hypothetical protein